MKIFKKNILNMTDANAITDIANKMEQINKILDSNLFNNPVREVNENLRKELLEFREIFLNNLNTLEKTLVIIINSSKVC